MVVVGPGIKSVRIDRRGWTWTLTGLLTVTKLGVPTTVIGWPGTNTVGTGGEGGGKEAIDRSAVAGSYG